MYGFAKGLSYVASNRYRADLDANEYKIVWLLSGVTNKDQSCDHNLGIHNRLVALIN